MGGRADAEHGEGEAKLVSSVPEALRPAFRANSDLFIASEEVLADFRGIVPIHRPHGHAHITEFTHALLGVAIARAILCAEQPDRSAKGPCAKGEERRLSAVLDRMRNPLRQVKVENSAGAGAQAPAGQQGNGHLLDQKRHRSTGTNHPVPRLIGSGCRSLP